jgi:hypothetical protein
MYSRTVLEVSNGKGKTILVLNHLSTTPEFFYVCGYHPPSTFPFPHIDLYITVVCLIPVM